MAIGPPEEELVAAKPLVLDNGTGLTKNGYAGEDQPRSYGQPA